jgi:hypothetical protein
VDAGSREENAAKQEAGAFPVLILSEPEKALGQATPDGRRVNGLFNG